jgi:hypothetical protein
LSVSLLFSELEALDVPLELALVLELALSLDVTVALSEPLEVSVLVSLRVSVFVSVTFTVFEATDAAAVVAFTIESVSAAIFALIISPTALSNIRLTSIFIYPLIRHSRQDRAIPSRWDK